jgi:4-amino-4-deoxy-L-arabinose transferase-like glycosyltransferase
MITGAQPTRPSSVAAPERRLAPRAGSPAWIDAALALLILVVYAAGLLFPELMGTDAPQDAVMGLRMHREADWAHLVKNGRDYLDKPHLLFWSAMLGYRLFGVADWSYRLPSVLVSLLGGWSTLALGTRLHGRTAGKLAAVMFLSSQAILLGNHDVRMDALLTGFTAFGLWQLVRYLDTGDARALALGAAGVALAFCAKGMVAVAVSGCCVLLHVWSKTLWRRLWSWKTALGVAVFLLVISPILVAYHRQFGLPGVRFILLGQSLARFSGQGPGRTAAAEDPLFFLHTLLWAFLPWSLLAYGAWSQRIRELFRGGWESFRSQAQATFLGPLLFLGVLSFSRFKLPHYLNPLLPMIAILTAGHLTELEREGRLGSLRLLASVQRAVVAALLAVLAVLGAWSFPVREPWVLAGAAAIAVLLVWSLRIADPLRRVWVPSAVAILLVNFVLDTSFYPQLGRYQPGSELAARALREDVDWDHTYFAGEVYQPFQFYTGKLIPNVDASQLRADLAAGNRVFVLVNEADRRRLLAEGLAGDPILQAPDCRITKLDRGLLDPRTRGSACRQAYLLRLRPAGRSPDT